MNSLYNKKYKLNYIIFTVYITLFSVLIFYFIYSQYLNLNEYENTVLDFSSKINAFAKIDNDFKSVQNEWDSLKNDYKLDKNRIEPFEEKLESIKFTRSLDRSLKEQSQYLSIYNEYWSLRNSFLNTLIQIFGGVFFFVTAFFTWRNIQLEKDRQVSEIFCKSVELLSSSHIESCLGGIHSLERIAKDSPQDHWIIIETISGFIKTKSSEHSKYLVCIQAAINLIRNRNAEYDNGAINLSNVNLSNINLSGINLSNSSLINSNLENSILYNANLQQADLSDCNLCGAKLGLSNIEDCELQNISWNNSTEWPNKIALEKANNLPAGLLNQM